MHTLPNPDQHSQPPAGEKPKGEVDLLRHALTNAAAAIAGLLTDHPSPAVARTSARAWLRTWEAYKLANQSERNTVELVGLAGGAR